MNKEIKRQLILSGILLCLLVVTLFLWYSNFMFHTYVNVVDYQYCFAGENEALQIDGYEFYKNNRVQKNGKARIMALQDQFFLKDDIVKTTFVIPLQQDNYLVERETRITTDNEAFTLDEVETTAQLYENDFANLTLHIVVLRDDKTVYDQKIPMTNQNMTIYNGSNKDYTIRNVYATSNWMKTGDFSSTLKDIEKDYPNMTIDYLYLKENGDEDNVNDYERFAYVKGKTSEILKDKEKIVAFYDGKGSLLDRSLSCVVTLTKDDQKSQPYTFMIPLHGTIKEVDAHE